MPKEAHMKPTSHTDMVSNILGYWDSATPVQREAGARWYKQAGEIVTLIAEQTGIESQRVAHCLSALSPRNPWRWNVFDCYSYAMAAAEGRTIPSATTFKRNWLAGWRAITGESAVWLTAAPKVRAFVFAILGDESSVVVDTWAIRVATGGQESRVKSGPKQYGEVAHAFNIAANLRGVPPSTMQAVTWLVAQTEGLATHRRGRHDLSFKAGTPEFIRAALQEGTVA
jgi:hypothetical protein